MKLVCGKQSKHLKQYESNMNLMNLDFRYNHECSGGEESSSLSAVPPLSLLSSNWTVWTFFPQKVFSSHLYIFFFKVFFWQNSLVLFPPNSTSVCRWSSPMVIYVILGLVISFWESLASCLCMRSLCWAAVER